MTFPTAPIEDADGADAAGRSSLVTASALTLVATLALLAVGLVRSKVAAVVLGQAGVGVLANLTIFNALAISLGVALAGNGAVRAIAAARARDDDRQLSWLIPYVLAAPLIAGVVMAVVVAIFAEPLSVLVTGSADHAGVLTLSAIAIPLGLGAASAGQVLQGFVRITTIVKADVFAAAASIAATVFLILTLGLAGAALALGAVAAARLAFLARGTLGLLPRTLRLPNRSHLPELRGILGLGAAVVVVGLGTTLANLLIRANVVHELGIEANGIYQPVSAISDSYLEIVLASTSLYLFPRLSALFAAKRLARFAAELGNGMRVLLAIIFPTLILGVAFSETVVGVLYSGEFVASTDPLALQMIGNALKVIAWSVGAAMLPLGQYRAWAAIAIGHILLKYVLSILLTPSFGLIGLALAYDAAWAATAVVVVFAVQRAGVGPPDYEWKLAGLAVISTTAIVIAHLLRVPGVEVAALVLTGIWLFILRRNLAEAIGVLDACRRRGSAA